MGFFLVSDINVFLLQYSLSLVGWPDWHSIVLVKEKATRIIWVRVLFLHILSLCGCQWVLFLFMMATIAFPLCCLMYHQHPACYVFSKGAAVVYRKLFCIRLVLHTAKHTANVLFAIRLCSGALFANSLHYLSLLGSLTTSTSQHSSVKSARTRHLPVSASASSRTPATSASPDLPASNYATPSLATSHASPELPRSTARHTAPAGRAAQGSDTPGRVLFVLLPCWE